MTTNDFSNRWFYKAGTTKVGPVSTDQLRGMLQRQALTADSPVWRDGMETWLPAGEVSDLVSEGGILPPYAAGTSGTHASRPAWTRWLIIGCAALIAVSMGVSRLLPRRDGDPFTYRRVSGEVLYEDGQVIPSTALTLTFIPLSPPHSPRVHPRPGFAKVDPKTGAFPSATTRKAGDGLVEGGHKVLLSGDNRRPLPEDLVPAEYSDFVTTPLEVDTSAGRFTLKIKRPLPKPVNADKPPKS